MIKIEKVDVYGWEAAIRGMRNPKNSWDNSDSFYGCRLKQKDNVNWEHHKIDEITECDKCGWCEPLCLEDDLVGDRREYIIGKNDLSLMKKLVKAGSDHAKFMRFINVTMDITAPLYWWKEYDTYKVGTVANSCSTMHKLPDNEFTLDDFSCQKLGSEYPSLFSKCPKDVMRLTIDMLNKCRELYLKTEDKYYWWQMIQLLPSSYNQKRTVMLNYEVLTNIYKNRKVHKLDEWVDFCKWIETLPISEIITGGKNK